MAKVFLSHATEDHAKAEQVLGWLTGHDVFYDKTKIRPGDYWQTKIFDELRRADAVVCIYTPTYNTRWWCVAELAIAHSLGRRIIAVRFRPDTRHDVLDQLQHIDVTDSDEDDARERLTEELFRLDNAGGRAVPDGSSPFPGLEPLDTDSRRY